MIGVDERPPTLTLELLNRLMRGVVVVSTPRSE